MSPTSALSEERDGLDAGRILLEFPLIRSGNLEKDSIWNEPLHFHVCSFFLRG